MKCMFPGFGWWSPSRQLVSRCYDQLQCWITPQKILKTWEVVTTFGFILFPFQGWGVGTLMSFIFLDYDKFNNGNILSSVCGWLLKAWQVQVHWQHQYSVWMLESLELQMGEQDCWLPDRVSACPTPHTTLYCTPFESLLISSISSKTGWGLPSTYTCFSFFDL